MDTQGLTKELMDVALIASEIEKLPEDTQAQIRTAYCEIIAVENKYGLNAQLALCLRGAELAARFDEEA